VSRVARRGVSELAGCKAIEAQTRRRARSGRAVPVSAWSARTAVRPVRLGRKLHPRSNMAISRTGGPARRYSASKFRRRRPRFACDRDPALSASRASNVADRSASARDGASGLPGGLVPMAEGALDANAAQRRYGTPSPGRAGSRARGSESGATRTAWHYCWRTWALVAARTFSRSVVEPGR
jgi:hypothetical protein